MFATDGPSVAPGGELAWWLLAGGILYFAPTLAAVARHRGAAPLTFYLNLLLGWTIIGWLVAWVLAFRDRRLRLHVSTSTTPWTATRAYPRQAVLVLVAPDGRHWWDGHAWRDGWQVAPRRAIRSPDGAHWFSGTDWVLQRAHSDGYDSGTRAERPRIFPEQLGWWDL